MVDELFEETKWEWGFENAKIHTEIQKIIQNTQPKITVRDAHFQIAVTHSQFGPFR